MHPEVVCVGNRALVLFGTKKLLAASVFTVKINEVSLNCSKTIFQLRLIFISDVAQRDHAGRKTHLWKSLELTDPGNRNLFTAA